MNILISMTRVTSKLKIWLRFNDKSYPMETDKKPPVVGQPSSHCFDWFPLEIFGVL
jgi:hypothetical protein